MQFLYLNSVFAADSINGRPSDLKYMLLPIIKVMDVEQFLLKNVQYIATYIC